MGVALRRCDRGTDAMHLANTPVVSPESKNPVSAGFSLCSNCRFLTLPSGAALPSMKGLLTFLARFQLQANKRALFVKNGMAMHPSSFV